MTNDRLIAWLQRIPPTERCRHLMLIASIAIAVAAAWSPATALLALLGCWLFLATLIWPASAREGFVSSNEDHLGIRPIWLRLIALARVSDPLLRRLAVLKLAEVRREVDALAAGTVFFHDTEGWRTAYADLLLSPDVTEYLSVAWVINEDYWRDPPGEHSLRTNFAAIDRGVSVARICILGWNLWPPELSVPLRDVLNWINDQHYRGIAISLVRETDLVAEPDLLRDFGIYGHRATGEQQLDRHARTVGFTLSFDPADVALARDRWHRLQLFAQKYQELMDRAGTPI